MSPSDTEEQVVDIAQFNILFLKLYAGYFKVVVHVIDGEHTVKKYIIKTAMQTNIMHALLATLNI